MPRRYESVEARRGEELDHVKTLLKGFTSSQRRHVLAWLCAYFSENGDLVAQTTEPRRRIAIDGEESWLVPLPKKRPPEARSRFRL
jgi:hypothetical protein